MKFLKQALICFFCICLLFFAPSSVFAAPAPVYEDDVFNTSAALALAGGWLKQNLPAPAPVYEDDVFNTSAALALAGGWLKQNLPAPAQGNELELLALLRGGFETPSFPYVQAYLASLKQHYANGGIAAQGPAQTAQQALVLSAAGINPAGFDTGLATALQNAATINAAGFGAQYWVLVLFAANPAMQQQTNLDIQAVAAALAQTQKEDGGFAATAQDPPNPINTAQAMQALAGHPQQQAALQNAQVWLALRTNDAGGFDINGSASPLATAAAMLAMDTQKKDPCFISEEAANMLPALLMFQAETGAFFANPDTPPTTQLTAACMLALVAKQRHLRREVALFDFSDVSETAYTPPQSPTGQNPTAPGSGLQNATQNPQFSLGGAFWLVAAAAALALLLVLFAGLAKRHKAGKTKPPKKKNKYTSQL